MSRSAAHAHRPLSLALAEKSAAMRHAIDGLLRGQPDIEVVGHAEETGGLLRLLREHRPHVLLLDPGAVAPQGVSALPVLREASSGTAILVTDFAPWQGYADELRRLGASGFVAKTAPPEDWLASIRAAAGP